jgi:hypothetical protein
MKTIITASLLSLFAATVSAKECNCSTYPFTPNPPCFRICVKALSLDTNADLSTVKNIDPGVAIGIKVLSEGERQETTITKGMDMKHINFSNINEKADLEREALKLLNTKSKSMELKGAAPQ